MDAITDIVAELVYRTPLLGGFKRVDKVIFVGIGFHDDTGDVW